LLIGGQNREKIDHYINPGSIFLVAFSVKKNHLLATSAPTITKNMIGCDITDESYFKGIILPQEKKLLL
jgi:hypothetical protein